MLYSVRIVMLTVYVVQCTYCNGHGVCFSIVVGMILLSLSLPLPSSSTSMSGQLRFLVSILYITRFNIISHPLLYMVSFLMSGLSNNKGN